jgi:hypothetical protein
MHGTITYSPKRNKQAAMNALFNDVQFFGMDVVRNISQWDALTCDEQMRLEDLVNTDGV